MRNKVPLSVLLLGLAGLIPPVGLVALAWPVAGNVGPQASGMLLAYAALILSFLGGTWWAFACREERPSLVLLAIAVVPSLAAWAALLFLRRAEALSVLALLLVAALSVDALLVRRGLAPAWWMGLRVPLSSGLALCCLAGALAPVA